MTVWMLNSNAQSPNWQWAKSADGSDYESETSVAVDVSGNSFVTGNFRSSTITFDTVTLTNVSVGSEDMFIVKYDSSGNVLWAKSAGGSILDRVRSVAVDSLGNSYAGGTFNSPSLTFGTTTLINASAGYDLFLVKYDPNGNVLWAKGVGGNSNEFVNTVVTDASGNCYAAGYFYSPSLTFGTNTITNSGSPDLFLAKYDSNGNALWAKSAIGDPSGMEIISSITTDKSENCYATGSFNYGTTVTFGTYTLTTAGNQDLFIVKYDSSGNVLWANSEGGTSYDRATSVVADNFGNNIYLAGSFDSDTLTIGSTVLLPAGSSDILLVKYDTSGNVLWAKNAGGIDDEYASSVAVDSSGNSYVTGNFNSPTSTFGTTILNNINAGTDDIFIVKYDVLGNILWATSAGGNANDDALFITANVIGECQIAGTFASTTISFGTTTLNNSGSSDIFLAKLNTTTTGITETETENHFVIYPNPASESMTVSVSADQLGLSSLKNGNYELKIFDLTGKEILQSELRSRNSEFDISKIENGIYFIQLKTGNGIAIRKFVKL